MTATDTTDAALLARIDQLLGIKWVDEGKKLDVPSEIYMGTINLVSQLFGPSSPQVATLVQAKVDIRDSNWDAWGKEARLVYECHGVLRTLAAEIKAGLVRSIRLQSQAEVFADFIRLAKTALDSGAKDTAAVLAAAALEDALKRVATSHGLSVDDHDMSDVVNALKAKGLVSGPQGTLLKGFVHIRNKALHAEWAKIDLADIQGLVAFTEQFVLLRLT